MENMNIVMIICLYDLNEIQGIKLHTQVQQVLLHGTTLECFIVKRQKQFKP